MAEITFTEWKGDPPSAPSRKVRQPNHFDAPFARSLETGKSFHAVIPPEKDLDRGEQLKAHVKALRNAARFADKGVDIRITEGGIWFLAREKKEPVARKKAVASAA